MPRRADRATGPRGPRRPRTGEGTGAAAGAQSGATTGNRATARPLHASHQAASNPKQTFVSREARPPRTKLLSRHGIDAEARAARPGPCGGRQTASLGEGHSGPPAPARPRRARASRPLAGRKAADPGRPGLWRLHRRAALINPHQRRGSP